MEKDSEIKITANKTKICNHWQRPWKLHIYEHHAYYWFVFEYEPINNLLLTEKYNTK